MIHAVLDLETLMGREDLHRRLRELLPLPAWYGNNLDALYDCLTDLQEEVQLAILHSCLLQERLGAYGTAFMAVLTAAQQENPRLQILLS